MSSIQEKREALLAANEAGTTELHWYLRYGEQPIPAGILTSDMLLISDLFGRRPIDFAARYRKFNLIPSELLNVEILSTCKGIRKEMDFWTASRSSGLRALAIHTAAEFGSIYQLTTQLLIDTLLIKTPECYIDEERLTGMHHAASNGNFIHVPRELITGENLMIENHFGQTVLHDLTRYNYQFNDLDQVLGTILPERSKEIVGEEWWKKNQQAIKAKTDIQESTNISELSLF